MLYLLLVAIVNVVLGYVLAVHLGYGPSVGKRLVGERSWQDVDPSSQQAAWPAGASDPEDVEAGKFDDGDLENGDLKNGALDESIAHFQDDLQRYRQQLARVDARLGSAAVEPPATERTPDGVGG